jgi:hypothetical protein
VEEGVEGDGVLRPNDDLITRIEGHRSGQIVSRHAEGVADAEQRLRVGAAAHRRCR